MNCRVLPVLSPHPGTPSPIMPTEVAMTICLAGSPPLCSFLSNCDGCYSSSATSLLTRCEPLQLCLSSILHSEAFCDNITTATTSSRSENSELSGSPSWMTRQKKKKKSVVFADVRGLALTAVHVFDEAEDLLPSFHLTELEGATAGLHLGDNREAAGCGLGLVLDFTPPAADYLDLRNRLRTQQVCLETCSVQERLLSGTVQVRNLSFDKSVSVRITFNSWRSFQDIPCLYLNNVYGCPDTDTFSFSVLVPDVLEPSNTVEFCIQYQTQDNAFWDNNQGNNYRLVMAHPNGGPTRTAENWVGLAIQRERGGEKREQMEFDPFGSPRTSAGIFPEWQSWGCVDTSAPYW